MQFKSSLNAVKKIYKNIFMRFSLTALNHVDSFKVTCIQFLSQFFI